ncbi:MAG: DedA family protein [Acidaminococcaceae bacterium]|nr:DedA family protein [Acidaminococcaceae bacterium]
MEFYSYFVDLVLHLDKHLPEIMAAYGSYIYCILFLVVFCETGLVVTPFLPGDSLLFACGAIAAINPDGMNITTIVIIFLVASVIGDACNYEIGKHVGLNLVEITHGFVKQEHIEKAQAFYAKHGHKAIFLARFVPIVRTFAPFVAGIGKMHYFTFAKYNVVGAIVWVGLFVGGGYFFGNIPIIKNNFSLVTITIILVSVLPVIIEFIRNRK